MYALSLAMIIGVLALSGCSSSTREPIMNSESEQTSSPSLEPPSMPLVDGSMPTVTTEPQPETESVGDVVGEHTESEIDTTGPGSFGFVEPNDGPFDHEQPTTEPSPDNAALASERYSDDFSTDTLSSWALRHQAVSEPPQYTLLDIDRTQPGALTIEPTRTPGWFADGTAPLVFKTVSGNFSVEVDVLAESAANPGEPPGANFNSAGLMARDPASNDGGENYVMVNLGRQNGEQIPVIGTETKTTRDSNSVLDIQPGTNRGRLILCRTASVFQSYRLLDNETEWSRIGTVQRPDLPATLEVGMVANGFAGPDLRATFFEISLRVPESSEDCIPL